MEEKQSRYITTTLPYVNSTPHIGFAMELVRADAVARYYELLGNDVFLNTGTDEHGSKIFEKAEELGISTQEYTDEAVVSFQDLVKKLGVKDDVHFIRTTNEDHKKAAQEFWKRCEKDIYKGTYEVKYCVGCELEKTDSELQDGQCPLHPSRKIELREEENYYFAFSKYQDKLLSFYDENPQFVVPEYRMKEIRSFIEQGLHDFSISRLKTKMPWGVEVPGDSDHVMYVWFDALVNYISTLEWPEEGGNFEKYWVNGRPVQYAGKDNLRQQSAMWQAMLMSAGLPHSHKIVIDGFITSEGKKMSKSLGNVIDPVEWIGKYGVDAVRYYLLRELHPFEDSDATGEKMEETYNANLVNGLGNQVSRVMNMVVSYDVEYTLPEKNISDLWNSKVEFDLQEIMDSIWREIQENDKIITEKEPFKLVKTDEKAAHKILKGVVLSLYEIARTLEPFMPETSQKIQDLIEKKEKPTEPLFPRLD